MKDLIAAVDRKGFGSITYVDFEAVMARSMLQTANPAEETVHMSSTVRLSPNAGSIPFHEVCLLIPPMQPMFLIVLYIPMWCEWLHAPCYVVVGFHADFMLLVDYRVLYGTAYELKSSLCCCVWTIGFL